MNSPIMTAQEAAEFLKVSINNLYAMLKATDPNERIPAFRSGGKWFIHRDVLNERIKRGNNI